uniref:HMA domain-containing protein n=1 Tax=Oryza glumipatula TaxID=40148 RepID=A0A0D9ZK89_9ORYZ
MPTLIITVDLQCCRCNIKIQKVLCCMQDWIQSLWVVQPYNHYNRNERGELEIEKIVYEKDTVVVSGPFDAEKLSCKLWCKAGKIIKDIKIKPPEEKKKPEPKPEEKKPDPKPKPDPCKLIPFPYPYVYPPPPPCGGCTTPHCCDCHPKPPPPAPAPAKPACGCPAWSSPCHCYPPPAMPPYPPVLVCDEGPQYGACAVM